MKKASYSFILSAVFAFVVRGDPAQLLPFHARGGSAFKKLIGAARASKSTIDAQYWEHALDNFPSENSTLETFTSKYFIDTTYYVEGGPSFLYIGGEGPLSSAASGFIDTLAEANGGKIYSLEHRFYGESLPEHNISTALGYEYLSKYHNVDQSLADLAKFITMIEDDLPESEADPEWFAIGGSYPGALASWFRAAYPNSTVGSLSSSGVINAIFSFPEFDEQVAISAGSDCANAIRATTAALQEAIGDTSDMDESSDAARVKALFNVPNDGLTWEADFWYMAADSAAMAVQYGMKDDLCEPLTAASNDGSSEALIETFANITNDIWGDSFASDCFYDTNCLSSSTEADRWQPTARSWRWQKCSQLAYFQIAPSSGSLRSEAVTMQYHLDQCSRMFGDSVDPKTATEAWNAKMGGDNPYEVDTFFANGSDDPWQRASISPLDSPTNEPNDQPAILAVCDSCGHCGDLHSPSDSDPANLTAQREAISKYVAEWLST